MDFVKVFVYGTLMTGMENHHIVVPFIADVQPAITKGLLYHLPMVGYPAMIDGSGTVKGELLVLSNATVALSKLDELEDYFGPDSTNNLYIRAIRDIEYSGRKVAAYTYIWTDVSKVDELGIFVADGNWRKFLLNKPSC